MWGGGGDIWEKGITLINLPFKFISFPNLALQSSQPMLVVYERGNEIYN